MTDIGKRLRAEYQLAGRPITKGRLLIEAADEIERLQEAKRRALAIADERSKENVRLRKALETIQQRANESGTGEMGLLDTVHAMHKIARDALSAVGKMST
jgi:hypothetical protein